MQEVKARVTRHKPSLQLPEAGNCFGWLCFSARSQSKVVFLMHLESQRRRWRQRKNCWWTRPESGLDWHWLSLWESQTDRYNKKDYTICIQEVPMVKRRSWDWCGMNDQVVISQPRKFTIVATVLISSYTSLSNRRGFQPIIAFG